jgi:polysaccharide export outer membrane protein
MKTILLYGLASLLLCVGCAQTPFTHTAAKPADLPVSTPESASTPGGDYPVGKGDVLEVSVWREPMLSGETVVRSDGMISVALLGDISAAGRTPMELKNEIQKRLKEYIGEPAVTVTVKTPASQKFYVVGEVRTPGEYNLLTDLTVVQGIARAGGFTEWASKDKILLLRKENGVERRIRINYKDIIKGEDSSQAFLLRSGDTIVVP